MYAAATTKAEKKGFESKSWKEMEIYIKLYIINEEIHTYIHTLYQL